MRSWQNSTIWTLGRLDRIAVRDLGAEEAREDETEYCDDGEYEDMLVACPVDGEVSFHQFNEAKKGPSSDEEKEGDKHRR